MCVSRATKETRAALDYAACTRLQRNKLGIVRGHSSGTLMLCYTFSGCSSVLVCRMCGVLCVCMNS